MRILPFLHIRSALHLGVYYIYPADKESVLAVWCLLCIGSLAMISTIALWQVRRQGLQTDAGR